MKINRLLPPCAWLLAAFILILSGGGECVAQFKDILRDFRGAVSGKGASSSSRIVDALKEALKIGTENAVAFVSRKDGFLAEEAIRILLPPSVKKTETLLRAAGYGRLLNEFEVSMNRAAEKAAPLAGDVFKKALSDMTFEDAERILKGDDIAATRYFREKTEDKLFKDLKPVVHRSMEEVGATKRYLELEERVRDIPFADLMSFNLDDYVTKGALDGIFLMLGREEKKIRTDPAARVTDLLKEVFGNK